MTAISHEYLVYNKEGFKACLDKLTKRYKVSCDLVWGDTPVKDIIVVNDQDVTVFRYPVEVLFSFEGYKIDGYTYLGCIKNEEMMGFLTIHGNDKAEDMGISDFINNFDGIPCHNCNRKHARKIGHVFQVDATKELIVFGSTCAKNFFGINFSLLLNFFERIELGIDGWDDDYIRGMKTNFVDFKYVSRLAYMFIKKYGYTSVSKASNEGGVPTSEDVKKVVQSRGVELLVDEREIYEEVDVDFAVLGTEEYVKDTDNLSDFDHNVLVLQEKMNANLVSKKDIGMICFLVYKTFFQVKVVKPENHEYNLPEWDLKYRFKNVAVIYDGSHTFEGSFGVTNIHTFISEDNIRFKWFTGINLVHKLDREVQVGDKLILTATVKDLQDDPKWGKSVMVNRAIVKEGK